MGMYGNVCKIPWDEGKEFLHGHTDTHTDTWTHLGTDWLHCR